MRSSCIRCIARHFGQAIAILESMNDPPKFNYKLIYALGHLAEAESLAVCDYPDIADSLKLLRSIILRTDGVDFDSTAQEIYEKLREVYG